MHEDDAWECMRVQVIENQWGVPDSDRDDKRQVGRGGAKEEGHPFLLQTISNIFDVFCKLQSLISGRAKQRERFTPFLLRILSWILFTNYIFFILGKGKAIGKGHPFLPRTASYL